MSEKLLSFVIPAYCEQKNLLPVYQAIQSVMEKQIPDYGWEIIFVDDSGAQIVLAEVGSLNILEDHQGNLIVLLLVESIGVKVQQAVVAFLREA